MLGKARNAGRRRPRGTVWELEAARAVAHRAGHVEGRYANAHALSTSGQRTR